MKKVIKVVVKVCKWLTLLPKLLDMIEAFAETQKDSNKQEKINE